MSVQSAAMEVLKKTGKPPEATVSAWLDPASRAFGVSAFFA